MVAPKYSEEEFIALFEKHGALRMSQITGMGVRGIQCRRQRLEARLGRSILPPDRDRSASARVPFNSNLSAVQGFNIDNGHVLIGSDSHYWPNYVSPSHRAFVKFCKELKPKAVIKNGDALDGASISRFPSIGWEEKPTLVDEIETVAERLTEIEDAAKGAQRFWPLGNHDARFETRLAAVAPEYARVHGVHLKDHFPLWQPCWMVEINDDVVVKHRFKGGIHATRNNTLNAGKTMITGHLHSLKVTPFTDYTGTRFGVDCGTMAHPDGPQFINYTEASPKDWRQGFIVLTFHRGKLLWPEVCHVVGDDEVEFRGKVYAV